MAIKIKNEQQIELMREAGKIVAKTHELLEKEIRQGITTKELNDIAHRFILSMDATPSFLGYNGYPASICVSINEEVIHGIPGLRKLKNGDIVSIDIGAIFKGYHGDAARSHIVGEGTEEAKRLVNVTRESFFEGIKYARAGCHLNDICTAIEKHVVSNGFSVVSDFVGHGIGTKMHEEPQVPNVKMKVRGPKLTKGMALAIEPMVNVGTANVKILNDDWTVVTLDKKNSAHYENTIIITDGEPEILTMY